jgi:glycosyltransferase involved in cell wall biosynthesis
VLSHLRWDWVWQRPQHLISRMAQFRRTLFVEEPLAGEVSAPCLRVREEGLVTRLWLEVPRTHVRPPEYEGTDTAPYLSGIDDWLSGRECDVWLYTPTAMPIAEALRPRLLAYDVMDDLSSFADATPRMESLARRALALAHVAFAGGRSLHRNASGLRRGRPTYLFPSGVETAHYARSRDLRCGGPHPVAGYVGVLDERLDMPLLGELASLLHDWEIRLVGPSTKIDPQDIPTAANITMLGQQPYERLPEIMAGFDVALMPFALNDATRSISPTKTLEYLVAGLPVVSTPVADVVADWGGVVHVRDDAESFAEGCRLAVTESPEQRMRAVSPLLERYEWDNIAREMTLALEHALEPAARAVA